MAIKSILNFPTYDDSGRQFFDVSAILPITNGPPVRYAKKLIKATLIRFKICLKHQKTYRLNNKHFKTIVKLRHK